MNDLTLRRFFMMNIRSLLAIIAILLLAACGGGGGGGGAVGSSAPQTLKQTVSGVVADGYLSGATVCLDTNLNKKCDSGEPSAITGAGGVYSIPNVLTADLARYPVVAEVPAGAVDTERGTVTTGYVLTAPAGRPEFVSPLTTLVQHQIETSGLSMTDAVAAIKTQLGLTTISPLSDYQPGVAGASPELTMAAAVAKVIATTLADNKNAIETAVAGSATQYTVQQVMNLVVQQVMQSLSALVMQVQIATNNGADALAENKVAGVVSSSGITIPTSDIASLQQQLAATGTTNTASTMKLTIALQGTGATSVRGVQATITFPAGVLLRTDATGKPLPGVLAAMGSAASGLINGQFTPETATAPASLTLGLITTTGLAAGDIIVINADLASGISAPTAGSFAIAASKLVDTSGSIASGASLALR
jgi:hypothetical protein